MPNRTLALSVLAERLAVCRLDAGSSLPAWATKGPFFCATGTRDEVSIVCPERHVPSGVTREPGWRALKLHGPFDLGSVGVLAAVAAPLAEVGVSIFAIATYDTDYILVKQHQLEQAVSALSAGGHTVEMEPD